MFGLFSGLFSGKMKWILGGIAIAAIVAGIYFIVSGFYDSINNQLEAKDQIIESQREQITNLQEQVAGLTADLEAALQSNETLSRDLDRRIQEVRAAFEEISRLNELDLESAERISELEKIIENEEIQERIQRLREGRRAELFLDFANDYVDCWVENFDRIGGRCVQGEWREND